MCAVRVVQNKEKTIEIHVIAQLDDFYGEQIRAVALGYVRPEANFASLQDLKVHTHARAPQQLGACDC